MMISRRLPFDPMLFQQRRAKPAAAQGCVHGDPVTKVGLVEPMRVEDAYQRRGLARAMLTAGLDRLAKRGTRRLKVGYATDVVRGLYVGAGFRVTSTTSSFSRRRPVATD